MFAIGNWFVRSCYDTSKIKSSTDYYILHNLGGTLLILGSNDHFYSFLANSWDVDREAHTIVFELRDDIKFSNGAKITSQDVAFTFKRLILTGSMHLSLKNIIQDADKLKGLSSDIAGIEVLNDHRIRFHLTTISIYTLFLFTQPDGGIINRDQVNDKTLEIEHWRISSGAYFMPDNHADKNILKANPYFIWADKNMLQDITIVTMVNNKDQLKALSEGQLHYLFDGAFNSEEEYALVKSSKLVDIKPKNICATVHITLNKKISIFKDKRTRQAIFKQVKKTLPDLRPLKNDRYFITTDQFVMPTQIGKTGHDTYLDMIKDYPDKWDIMPVCFESLRMLLSISEDNHKRVVDLFAQLGIHVKEHDMEFLSREQQNELMDTTPFYVSVMYMDEKEIFDAIEYMDQMDTFFADNRNKIMELNMKLVSTDDKAVKSSLMKEINRLIIDDAVVIPLYHIVNQTLINSDYQIIDENEFTTAPRLWNVRRKVK